MRNKEYESVRQIENSSCCYRKIKGDAIRLIWEITGRCNLKCHHCFANISNGNDHRSELTTDEAIDIVRQFKKNNIGKVMITGGEPFVRKDLIKILSVIRSENPDITIDITTNATLITDETIEILKKYNIDELSVSFDGIRPVYTQVRGTNIETYDDLVKTLEKSVSIGIKIDGILVLTKETETGLLDALIEGQRIGFSSFSISKLLRLPHSNFDYNGLALDEEEHKEVLKKIKEYQKLFEGKMIVRTVGFVPCAAERCANSSIIAINRNGEYMHCLNYYDEDDIRLDSRKVDLSKALKIINKE